MLARRRGAGNKDFQSYFSKYYKSYAEDNNKKFKNPEKKLFEPKKDKKVRSKSCLGSNILGNLKFVKVSV